MNEAAITELVQKAHRYADAQRRLPESTYRLQFHKGFTFANATAIIPYLAELGITHVYASPYLRSTPGSTHGYDVIDHCRLNPEYGSDADYEAFVQSLAQHGLHHILDTVPNHMGIATNENNWWNDVLENGPSSRFGSYFDIAWRDSPRPELKDRVLVPILGQPYWKALEDGQLKLSFNAEAGSFAISYFARTFPVNPASYGRILDGCSPEDAEMQSIRKAIANLPESSNRDPTHRIQRANDSALIKRRLAALAHSNASIRASIDASVDRLNETKPDAIGYCGLDNLLSAQSYRLAYWRVASEEINYRRFFDINGLAAMAMAREDVFEETHALTLRLIAEGKVAGLRIDHPDGLYDPEQYFKRLQSHYLLACAQHIAATDPAYQSLPWDRLKVDVRKQLEQESGRTPSLYVVAEKIVAIDERLPRDWPVSGTTGYRFLNMINGLFVDPSSEQAFTDLYTEFVSDSTSFEDLIYQKKRLVLNSAMSSELHALSHRLAHLAGQTRRSRDLTHRVLREALAEVIACFPVYRTYITGPDVTEVDRGRISAAINSAIRRNPKIERDVFDFIQETLLQHAPPNCTDVDRAEHVAFAGKFQQLTSPVTAKGVEDTAFYIFNRLVSLNEVGGDPDRFGIAPDDLHTYLAARQNAWPHAMSAMSTHDTKRSEDVRARLNVLSEMPDEWQSCIKQWQRLNGPSGISANEQYLLYQALIGAWPIEPYSVQEYETFIKRVQAYMLKAMREAKVNTSWTDPNADHEKSVNEFIGRVLSGGESSPFLTAFRPFARRIASWGLINSLSQTLLKLAAPGVPDTYQGTELWDLSLVDPDNRRPVDYAHRRRIIEELHAMQNAHRENLAGLADDLIRSTEDGRIKFWMTWQLLQCRRDHPGLFSLGSYTPIRAIGSKSAHIMAFAREYEGRIAIVIVPRLIGKLAPADQLPIGSIWSDTAIELPDQLKGRRYRDLFTGNHVDRFEISTIFKHLPIAALISEK